MKKIMIINGPNLNLLGTRETEIYGNEDFNSFFNTVQQNFPDFQLDYFQSNVEGEIINKLHEVGFSYDGIVLNAGAYAHTSIAIADAVKAINTQVVEVHISNIFKREEFRHHSFLSSVCKACITGFGLDSYQLALYSFSI